MNTTEARAAGRGMRSAAAVALALAALLPAMAQALVLGVTEGVTYRATDGQIEARFQPLADALSRATRQPVSIKVISAYNDLREALREHRLDIAFIHPAHVAYEAVKTGTYRTMAWTSGFTDYKVSFLCKSPTPISDWREVIGKKVVTPDPDSITAVMTRAMLREHGLPDGGSHVQTTRYQDAVPFYVEHGFATYGATAARGVIKAWRDAGGKTCAESRPVAIKQWVVSAKLEAATATQLRDTLLGLGNTETGRKALAVSTYTGFIAPPAESENELLAWLGL